MKSVPEGGSYRRVRTIVSVRWPLDYQLNAPAQRPAHKVFQEDVVLENLLDIETVTTAFPVILRMECTVSLDADPGPF